MIKWLKGQPENSKDWVFMAVLSVIMVGLIVYARELATWITS